MNTLYNYRSLNELMGARASDSTNGIRFIKGSTEEMFVSYADFFDQCKKFLYVLQSKYELKKGSEVIIYEDDNFKFLRCFWACLLGGFVPVPLAIGGKNEHKHKFFKVVDTLVNPFVFCDTTNLDRLIEFGEQTELTSVATMQDMWIDSGALFESEFDGDIVEAAPQDLAFIQFSSGSTGDPKGVMLTHENLIYNGYDLTVSMDIDRDDVYFCWIPLTHDMGMIAFHLTSVVAGCTHVMMPTYLFIRRPLLWMEKTHEHRASKLCAPNFGYQYFLQAYYRANKEIDWDLSSVKSIFNGAEPISASLCDEFTTTLGKHQLLKTCIVPSYGLAEASVGVSMGDNRTSVREYIIDRASTDVGDQVVFKEESEEGKTLSFVGIGPSLLSCEVAIHDEAGNELPRETLGYIDIKGMNVTQGYYQNPTATANAFVKDGWLRTGDLGFLLKNNTVVITGRVKNMMILQGQNYYAHDIESYLLGTADISLGKVAVCGIPGNAEEREKLLVFVLFKKKPEHFIPLLVAVQNRLSEAIGMIPDEVIPVREIPKTTSGKVQHSFLLKKYVNREFDTVLSDVQQALITSTTEAWKSIANSRERWAKIMNWLQEKCASLLQLAPDDLALETPLSDQGFKSMHAIQLNQLLTKRLGVPSVPTVVYKHPTITQLASYVEEQLYPSITVTQTVESKPMTDADLLASVEAMTDEEVLKLLND
ncbi:putative Long-chain-fatty-acid--(acyl-carrier-protein) ligase [Tenacibaculum litopenaei]|uniref:AMP-binding protein n=1 Tax=Tenacibaculum litopenaei TaxID=396016 RepID=UPI003895B70F